MLHINSTGDKMNAEFTKLNEDIKVMLMKAEEQKTMFEREAVIAEKVVQSEKKITFEEMQKSSSDQLLSVPTQPEIITE